MPRREDIEKFREVLNSLGGEPEITAQKAQPVPEEAPPGEGEGAPPPELSEEPLPVSDFGLDLTNLPDIDAGPAEAKAPAGSRAPEEPAALSDLGELSGLEEAAPPGEAGEPSGEGIEAGDLDFSSLFGEETAVPPIQEIEGPGAEPEGPGAAEEFQIPAAEEPALQADLSQMEVLPEQPEEAPAAEPGEAAEPGAAAAPGEGDLESFDFGSFDLEAPPSTEEPTPSEPAPAEPTMAEPAGLPSEEDMSGIELPNLEDLSLAEPSAGGPSEPGAGEEAMPSGLSLEGLPEEGISAEGLPSEGLGLEGLPSEGLGLEGLEPGQEPASAEEAQMPSLEGFDMTGTGFEAPAGGEAFEAPPAPAEAELPGELPSEAPPEPAPQGPGEEGLADLGLDQLTFPEAPEGFGGGKEEPAAAQARKAPPPPPRREAARKEAPPAEEGVPELVGAEGEISLSPEQFARLRNTLDSLPRNLKIAVQDAIAEGRATGQDLVRLINLLVAGAAAGEIVAVLSRVTGQRIRIPAGYEKRSGIAFEAEQRTFAYAFRVNILPLIRVFALTVIAAAAVGYLGYRYVYRPLAASTNYRVGYTHLLGDRFTLANESFDRAVKIWPMKRWFYRYAEAFADKRQYILSEQKYDQLLAQWRDDRKALLDYAGMESTRLADYKKANDLLSILLSRNEFDSDALLAAGDNNLEWARTDATRFEPARMDYATLIEKYGERDEFLFRMMRYFIRTDNATEIERLRTYFASREGLRVNPQVYAELGGYLIDHRRLNYVKEVLLKADAVRTELPQIHYNLARYYRLVGLPQDELVALQATLRRLRPSDPLTAQRLTMEIDTHTRLGELYGSRKEYINSERELQRAMVMVEENQKNRLIGTAAVFGRPYADLGDLNYYIVGDLVTARSLYQKAAANSYFDPELDFKIGYTQYAAGEYADALASFMKTENEWGYPRDPDAPPSLVAAPGVDVDYSGKPPVNLLYSLGNCFYQRGDYFAAQGYYLRLLDRLETRRTAIGTLEPADKPEHRSLLQSLVKANNNLGVVLSRLAARTGDRTKRSQALVYLATASQIEDTLTRTPVGRREPGAKSIAALNQRAILYPVSGQVPVIDDKIPKNLGALSW